MKHVFIIGSKGIPAKYGGFETFVDCLTGYRKNDAIKYHVACMKQSDDTKIRFEYHNAECFTVSVPEIGPAKAVYYDLAALKECIRYIRANEIEESILYILACRIGPFLGAYKRKLEKLNCKIMVNPDGHEWKRAKWNFFIKKYWKFSEKLMVKHCDGLICDSVNIEKYIQDEYKKYAPKTCFIAYGADEINETSHDNVGERERVERKFEEWLQKNNIEQDGYYLIVGRFVPENNYETVIKEFLKSDSTKKLVLITNVENNKYYQTLIKNTALDQSERICFPGTVYDFGLLRLIRQNAFAYIHGHEVGGTNPSLLEALAATNLNLLLDVSFNREVGGEAAVYWTKEDGNLKKLLEEVEKMPISFRNDIGKKAKERIRDNYSWEKIVARYEDVFFNRGW